MASAITSLHTARHCTIHTSIVAKGIMRATIYNSPINLLDKHLATDLVKLLCNRAERDDINVVIFDSSVPCYGISHIDIHLLDAADSLPSSTNASEIVGYFVEATRLLSTIDVITIAEVNGRAHSPGSEIALQCDMHFTGPGVLFSQFENSIGLFLAAGAVPFLANPIGRARTFEYILAAKGVDAKTAEQIGWANTAYGTAEGLKAGVQALVERIPLFPRQSLIATKQSVNYDRPRDEDLDKDVAMINDLRVTLVAEGLMTKFINLTNDFRKNAFELGMPE